MKVLRTPDERFRNLDGFPYQANYQEIDDGQGGLLRIEVPANRKAWEALRTFSKPFLTAFSESDPGTMAIQFQEEIPGAKGQNHVTLKDAMHYTQDDEGEELAKVVIEFIAANP